MQYVCIDTSRVKVTGLMEDMMEAIQQEASAPSPYDPLPIPLPPAIVIPPGGWSPPAANQGVNWGTLLIAGAVVALVALNLRGERERG